EVVVRERFEALAAEIGDGRSAEEVAEGFLAIATENMANAIKKISVQRGYDVTGYALSCFGGAGGQHACAVADALGMKTVLIHPHSGILSAYGMGLADIRANRTQAVAKPLADAAEEMAALTATLGDAARDEVAGQGVPAAEIEVLPRLHLRYDGTDTPLAVPFGEEAAMRAAFEAAHKTQFGFAFEDKPIVVEAAEAEAVGGAAAIEETPAEAVAREPEPQASARVFTGGAWREAAVHADRAALTPGCRIDGPALIVEPHATIAVEPGWRAEVTTLNHIRLVRVEALPTAHAIGTDADPVMLEVFNNLFMSIAEQMGVTLQNTAYSVNIKERVDYSCAVFAADGSLVANAPHMPVHLGSMDRSVETIIAQNPDMAPGDVYALNAPYNGGTHLPDITVVTPVFDDEGAEILFYVASRGHHADVGGSAPGSMTPRATNVNEEGVLFDNFKMVDRGAFQEDALVKVLTDHPWPVRNVHQNVADLKAQIAANEKGVAELRKMVGHFGLDVVRAYMGHVQDNAAESVRRVLDAL
ncbi:MAG: hydantoinase B/oxoprolinase family protein, partial [Pseudomonadota bacterium]